jgi:hypothetical protein
MRLICGRQIDCLIRWMRRKTAPGGNADYSPCSLYIGSGMSGAKQKTHPGIENVLKSA